MYKKQTNASAKRSQNVLAEALIKLMYAKKFQDICVTDICANAGLGRKTFYRNFNSKEDVVQFIMDNAYKAFLLAVNVDKMNTKEIFIDVYNFILQHKDFVVMLYGNNLFRYVHKNIANFIIEENLYGKIDLSYVKKQFFKYIPPQIAALIVSLLESWIESGFADTAEELAGFTEDVMYGKIYK
jgi:AcrR family transcriptional regulator